jgi:hypothetical protein
LLAKGIDITGTPNGYLFTTSLSGAVGQTGVIIGYAVPNHLEPEPGLSYGETMSIHFQAAPAQEVDLLLTVLPTHLNNNVLSTVYAAAYDAGSNPVAADTLTFSGVTGMTLTPGTVSLVSLAADIHRIDLTVDTPHALQGVWLESVECIDPTSTSSDVVALKPFVLHQNRPNPFNPRTEIYYELTTATTVELRVYDATGRLVRTLVDAHRQGPGAYVVPWDGRNQRGAAVASGVYFYRLDGAGGSETQKMVLLR